MQARAHRSATTQATRKSIGRDIGSGQQAGVAPDPGVEMAELLEDTDGSNEEGSVRSSFYTHAFASVESVCSITGDHS